MLEKGKLTVIALLSMIILVACGASEDQENASGESEENVQIEINEEDYPEVIASVNGEEIEREPFVSYLEDRASFLALSGVDLDLNTDEGKQSMKELETQVLDLFINDELLVQVVENESIEVAEEEIQQAIEMQKMNLQVTNDEELEHLLAEHDMTLSDLREEAQTYIKREKYLDEHIVVEEASEEDMRDLYDSKTEQMELGEFEEEKERLSLEVENEQYLQGLVELLDQLREENEVQIYL
ncbi:SurA N-terminal domain-containing protein [Alkalihalobacillus trypoxylicola]|uniref:Peptidylprolyl isomerase n=1 Tax=Alkalihalobacillus trypoxylicola TaxID=519424 RepID=A0A161QAL5_9BACI|nr:SurA N-terminal domain-containing protein [Alkalihalobacillus trypoxylicola]KYG34867.1 hypothetical protein AZF04_00605 [Alkalihalobacillus trypoxylicola]